MMADSFGWKFFLSQLIYAAPLLVAYFVGIAIAAARYRRHRRAAALAVAALAAMFVLTLISPLVQGLLLDQYQGNTPAAMPAMQAASIVSGVLRAVAVILLVVAVFVGRAPAEPTDD